MFLHKLMSSNPDPAAASAALASHVVVKAMHARDVRMAERALAKKRSESKRMVKRVFMYGQSRVHSRLVINSQLVETTADSPSSPPRTRKARDEPDDESDDERSPSPSKRSKSDEDEDKVETPTVKTELLPVATREEQLQHNVCIYAPLPGTLLFKYSMFVQKLGAPIRDVRLKNGKLFEHIEHTSAVSDVAMVAAVSQFEDTDSWVETETESDVDDSSSASSSASSVDESQDEAPSSVPGGTLFTVKEACRVFPSLCVQGAAKDIPFYVPYITGLEYSELECLLERMECEFPRMMKRSIAMSYEMCRKLCTFVRDATMVRFHGYTLADRTFDNPWTPSTASRLQIERVKRFVWSREIRCLQELLLEVPRLLLLRSVTTAVVHPRVEHKSSNERTVYSSADFIPFPGPDPLAEFLGRLGRNYTSLLSTSVAKKHRLLGTFLLENDCTALIDMGLAGMPAQKRSLRLSLPSDVLRVFLCRSERMMAHMRWLKSKLDEELVFTVVNTQALAPSSTSRVQVYDLRELLKRVVIGTEVYWDTVLTRDTSLWMPLRSHSAYSKFFCLFDMVFPEAKLLTTWDWVRFTTNLSSVNKRHFERALAAICEGYLDSYYPLDSLNKMMLRHAMKHSGFSGRTSVFAASVVLSSFESSNPDWATPPHRTVGETRDPDLWWIEDVYLAKLCSPAPLPKTAVRAIHAMYCQWLEPPETMPHVCLGSVDELCSTCVCREKLGLLCGWASGTTVNVQPLLASIAEHDEVEMWLAQGAGLEDGTSDEDEDTDGDETAAVLINVASLTEDVPM